MTELRGCQVEGRGTGERHGMMRKINGRDASSRWLEEAALPNAASSSHRFKSASSEKESSQQSHERNKH